MNLYYFVVLGLIAVHVFIRYRRFGRFVNKIPGPMALPFIGSVWRFFGNAEHLWCAAHEVVDQYYPIAKVWLPMSAVVLIRHPDDLEVLLSSRIHTEKGRNYSIVESWFKDSVFVSKGEKWQERRKLLTSTFHLENLKKYVVETSRCAKEMVEKIRLHGQVSDQELSTLFYKPLLYAFCDTTLDADLRTLGDDLVESYKKGMEDFFAVTAYRIVRPYITNWMMPFLSVGKKEKKSIERIFRLREEVVKRRRQYHEKTDYRFLQETVGIDEESEDLDLLIGKSAVQIVGSRDKRKRKLCMLDHLLLTEREGRLDEKGINEELDNMIFAGHGTMASVMVFITMLLAENNKAQELARKEVTEVFEKANGKLTMAEVRKLEYVDRCAKEALRLYPSAPMFMRYTKEDLYLKNYTIPAGADVVCMIFDTHRDPNFWSNPNEFDPDRFAPHLAEKRHPYAYLPFSAGIRNCMGQKIAMTQIKIMTAYVLYNFYLEPIDLTKDLKFSASPALHPNKPVYTKFIAITK